MDSEDKHESTYLALLVLKLGQLSLHAQELLVDIQIGLGLVAR